MRKHGLAHNIVGCLLVFLASTIHSAEDLWPDTQQVNFAEFSATNRTTYNHFSDQNDAQYTQWLSEQWQEYRLFRGDVRDSQPKPLLAPNINTTPSSAAELSTATASSAVATSSQPITTNAQSTNATIPGHDVALPATKLDKLLREQQRPPSGSLNFYGQQLSIPAPQVQLSDIKTEANIARNWGTLAQTDYGTTLNSLRQEQQRLHLSDWGMMQLIQAHARQHYNSANASTLYSWFLLNKLGFRLRAGMNDSQLNLLYAAQQTVYEKSYLLIEGERFYLLNTPLQAGLTLRTPFREYPNAHRRIDLRFAANLATAKPLSSQIITHNNKRYTITTTSSRRQFLDQYPQLDLKHYFRAPIAKVTADSLRQQLLPELKDKTPLQQVNWLLAWVQQSFDYQTDQAQYGKENYLHPEEALSVTSNDCEDRAFLFSWLVKELIGLPVIGLNYPGHVATAVSFNEDKQGPSAGQQLFHKGKIYWVADPTYIGAEAGLIMPQYRSITPSIL